jgi:hypothetical protein
MSEVEVREPAPPRERTRGQEAKVRVLLRVAGTTTAVGILLAAAGDESLARWLTLVGLVLLVVGLHRLGRLGADPPLELDAPPRARLVEK